MLVRFFVWRVLKVFVGFQANLNSKITEHSVVEIVPKKLSLYAIRHFNHHLSFKLK